MQSYIGRRVRLMEPMANSNSSWKSVEHLPAGSEGVVVFAQDANDLMMVNWDDGSHLNIFINEDKWEFVD